MKKTYCALMLLSISILFACQPDAPRNQESLSDATSANSARTLDDQAYLTQLVKDAEIADNERSLVHVSHTCTLTIDGQTYAAVDMRELVKGATTARGVNQVLLLNAENQLINRVEYGNARPLFCEDKDFGIEFDKVRIIEIFGGDANWQQASVTHANFTQGKELQSLINGQMIFDTDVAQANGKTFVTLSRPVMQRLLDGTTRGLLLKPLGALEVSFYDSEHGDGSQAPTLHFNTRAK